MANVVDLWQQDARRKATQEKAAAIVEKVNSGTSLKDAVAEFNLDVQTVDAITRSGENPSASAVPAPLVSDLFKIDAGKAAQALAGDSFAIASLTKVNVPEVTDESLDMVKTNLAKRHG